MKNSDFISHDPRGEHVCPAPGCEKLVSNTEVFCPPHWHAVPMVHRRRILLSYGDGNAGTVGHLKLIEAATKKLRK